MADPKKSMAKKKVKRSVPEARVYILAGFNNTLVTITDLEGKTISWSTSGAAGFKGSKKSTPYAAQRASEIAVEKARPYGIEKVHVSLKGVGSGREQAIRGLHLSGLDVLSIVDKTSTPHGGCRKKNPRKV
jgi:small subunit ribosomal protein S11